jgi:hypothetical protein
MGILSAIGIRKKVQFIKNGNTVIEFEASLNETHARQSTPTEFPIENGRTINDHIILKPLDLDMTMIITDKPISGLAGLVTEAATTLTSKLTPPIGTIALGAGLGGLSLFNALIKKSDSPSVAAYKQILKIQEQGEPFSVITSLNRYENMVISGFSAPREAANGQCLLITINLRQLTIVKPKTVQLKLLANPGLADGLHDLGQQNTTESSFIKGAKDGFADTSSALKSVSPGGVM